MADLKLCISKDDCRHPNGPKLPIGEFYYMGRQKYGDARRSECKACTNARVAARKHPHPADRHKAKQPKQSRQKQVKPTSKRVVATPPPPKGDINLIVVDRKNRKFYRLHCQIVHESTAGNLSREFELLLAHEYDALGYQVAVIDEVQR